MRQLVVVFLIAYASVGPAVAQSSAGRVSSLGLSVKDGALVRPAKTETSVETRSTDDAGEEGKVSRPRKRRQKSPETRRATAPTDQALRTIVSDACRRHRVDPALVYAVMNQESGFHSKAVSPKGASGYMQLMPGTARRFGVTDIFDPAQNIDAGVRYLRLLLDMFGGRVDLALAGYNAGEARVVAAGYQVPRIRETLLYVRAISARYGKAIHP